MLQCNSDESAIFQGAKTVKPIIGQTPYKDISPEELSRYMHEAELLRAEAVRDSLFAAYAGIKFAIAMVLRVGRRSMAGHHGAKAAGLR